MIKILELVMKKDFSILSWNGEYSRVTIGLWMGTLEFWDTCRDNVKHVARFIENIVRTW